jgi:hypothetical protein
MAIAPIAVSTTAAVQWFPNREPYQCSEWPLSSLLLVANKIDTMKTPMMTETTKNGEVMLILRAPLSCDYQTTKFDLAAGGRRAGRDRRCSGRVEVRGESSPP